jgi:hypothetical protein
MEPQSALEQRFVNGDLITIQEPTIYCLDYRVMHQHKPLSTPFACPIKMARRQNGDFRSAGLDRVDHHRKNQHVLPMR